MYYIGTDEYQHEWRNPSVNTLETEVEVSYSPSSSSNVIVVGNISSFVGRSNAGKQIEVKYSDLWLKSFSNSSFIVDLGETRKVLISNYTLRHFSQNCCFIRFWNIEGSNDSKNWDVIQTYEYLNSPFNTPNQTKTFNVQKISKFYRFFRIHQTGVNSRF
jgi:hypothetical protein